MALINAAMDDYDWLVFLLYGAYKGIYVSGVTLIPYLWPPASSLADGHYILLLMFLSSLFFSSSNLGGLWADHHQTLPRVRWWRYFLKSIQKFEGSLPPKIWRPKNIKILAQYLWTGTRYRRSENGVGNCNHSPTCIPNLVFVFIDF